MRERKWREQEEEEEEEKLLCMNDTANVDLGMKKKDLENLYVIA